MTARTVHASTLVMMGLRLRMAISLLEKAVLRSNDANLPAALESIRQLYDTYLSNPRTFAHLMFGEECEIVEDEEIT